MNIQSELQHASSLILKAKNIVLMPHAKMDCDGMSASVSLYLLLKKLGKNPTAVCSDPVPESFNFLPSSHVFSQTMPDGTTNDNKFLVTVDTKDKGFKNLKYTVENGKVNIVLFSDTSPFEETDFSFLGTEIAPDLIITLDSGDTQQLGNMYTDNFDLFESVPVINIDHHVSNTQFGDVNVVDFKSCSTTELVYRLSSLLSPEKNLLDADISTLILAGMLTDTGSFQHSNTTSNSLDIAADLITQGARHQEIVKHLFKTKSLATLRVWGRVLTKLENDPIYRIVWSSVSRNDLEETQAHSDETEGLIDELMATTPGTELVLLVKEREDNIISTSVRSSGPEVDSVEFTSLFGGGGHKQAAGFKIRERGGKSFEEIVSDIVFEAKKFQAQRLSLDIPRRDLISALKQEEVIIPVIPQLISQESIENKVPEFPHSLVNKPEVVKNIEITADELVSDSEKIIEKTEILENDKIADIPQGIENIEHIETIDNVEIKKERDKEVMDIWNANSEAVDTVETSNLEFTDEEVSLSPEEKSFLKNSNEYKISDPETEIEKIDEGNYIDDFADFLAKADEEEPYLTEDQASHISNISKNIEQKMVKDLDSFSSDLNNEDDLLGSLSSAKHEEIAADIPLGNREVNAQNEDFQPLPTSFVPDPLVASVDQPFQNIVPPIQNIDPHFQGGQEYDTAAQFPVQGGINPNQNIQNQAGVPSAQDPFLQSLAS